MTAGDDAAGAASDSTGLWEGRPVYSRDGVHLGTVGDVHGRMFTLRAVGQPDAWLRVDTIRATAGGRVDLRIDVADLDSAKASVSDRD